MSNSHSEDEQQLDGGGCLPQKLRHPPQLILFQRWQEPTDREALQGDKAHEIVEIERALDRLATEETRPPPTS